MQAWETGEAFESIVRDSGALTAHLTEEDITRAFTTDVHLRNVDTIFQRVGLTG